LFNSKQVEECWSAPRFLFAISLSRYKEMAHSILMTQRTSTRYVELDLLRTLAIILMIVYHFAYDLENYYSVTLFPTETGIGWWIGRGTAALFLLIVGCSFAISWSRHQSKSLRKYVLRATGLLACAMLVTLVTYLADPETYVRFGILHLIAFSIILLPFTATMKEWNAVLGCVILALGYPIAQMTVGTSLLLPLGMMPPDFFSVDYFPLLPWFGFVLIGYALGHFIYVRHTPRIFLPSLSREPFSICTWPGRHALVIYLIHQPILLGLLWLLWGAL
jgi:uncharacterized membrane protein